MCARQATHVHTHAEAARTLVLQQPSKSPTPLQAIVQTCACTHARTHSGCCHPPPIQAWLLTLAHSSRQGRAASAAAVLPKTDLSDSAAKQGHCRTSPTHHSRQGQAKPRQQAAAAMLVSTSCHPQQGPVLLRQYSR